MVTLPPDSAAKNPVRFSTFPSKDRFLGLFIRKSCRPRAPAAGRACSIDSGEQPGPGSGDGAAIADGDSFSGLWRGSFSVITPRSRIAPADHGHVVRHDEDLDPPVLLPLG